MRGEVDDSQSHDRAGKSVCFLCINITHRPVMASRWSQFLTQLSSRFLEPDVNLQHDTAEQGDSSRDVNRCMRHGELAKPASCGGFLSLGA